LSPASKIETQNVKLAFAELMRKADVVRDVEKISRRVTEGLDAKNRLTVLRAK
jgi:hypothetical protein